MTTNISRTSFTKKQQEIKVLNLQDQIKNVCGKYTFLIDLFDEFHKNNNEFRAEENFINIKIFLEFIENEINSFDEDTNLKNNETFFNETIKKFLETFNNEKINQQTTNDKIFFTIINKIVNSENHFNEFFKNFKTKFEEKKQKHTIIKRKETIQNILNSQDSSKYIKKQNNNTEKKLKINFRSVKTVFGNNNEKKLKIFHNTIFSKKSFKIPKKSKNFVQSYLRILRKKEIRRKKRLRTFCKFLWFPFNIFFNIGKFLLNTMKIAFSIASFITSSLLKITKFVTGAVKRLFSEDFWKRGFGRYIVTALLTNKSLLFWTTVFLTKLFKPVITSIDFIGKFVFRVIPFTLNLITNITKFLKNINLDTLYNFVNDTINLLGKGYYLLKNIIHGTILTILTTFITNKLLQNAPLSFLGAYLVGQIAGVIYKKTTDQYYMEKQFELLYNTYVHNYFLKEDYMKEQLNDTEYEQYIKSVNEGLKNRENKNARTKKAEIQQELENNLALDEALTKERESDESFKNVDVLPGSNININIRDELDNPEYKQLKTLKTDNPNIYNRTVEALNTLEERRVEAIDRNKQEDNKKIIEQIKDIKTLIFKNENNYKELDNFLNSIEGENADFIKKQEKRRKISRKNPLPLYFNEEEYKPDYYSYVEIRNLDEDKFKERLFDVTIDNKKGFLNFSINDKRKGRSKQYFLTIKDSVTTNSFIKRIIENNSDFVYNEPNKGYYGYITGDKTTFILFDKDMEEILRFPIFPEYINNDTSVETNIEKIDLPIIKPSDDIDDVVIPLDIETDDTNDFYEEQTKQFPEEEKDLKLKPSTDNVKNIDEEENHSVDNIPIVKGPDLPKDNLTNDFGLTKLTDTELKTLLSTVDFSRKSDPEIQEIINNLNIQTIKTFLEKLKNKKIIQNNLETTTEIAKTENYYNNTFIINSQNGFSLPIFNMDIFTEKETVKNQIV